MKKKFMKILSVCLAIVMVISVVPLSAITVSAVTTPSNVNSDMAYNKIYQLYDVLGSGSYFTTTNGNACGNKSRSHWCSNCKLSSIIKKNWFVNKFGNLSTSQFPITYYSNGSVHGPDGWSCFGFASFAEWYVFSNKITDKVTTKYMGTFDYNYSSVSKNVKIGDLIRLDDGHSAIAISYDSNGVKVLDSNWNGSYNCQVHMHTIKYSSYSKFSISRATNSIEEEAAPIPPSLTVSKTNISLGTINNTSTTVNVTCAGDWNTFGWTGSSSVCSINKTAQNGNTFTFKISAKVAGTDTLGFSLYDSNGKVVASKNVTVSVIEPTLSASASSISLSLSGTNTGTITLTAGGDLPSNYYINYGTSKGYVNLSFGGWSGKSIVMTVRGVTKGTDTISLSLKDSSNNAILAKKTITAYVSSPTYTVTYNANGGSGAPASQTKEYNQGLTLSSSEPTGKTYTVTFNGNGGTVATSSQQYTQRFVGWNTKSDGSGENYSSGSVYTKNANLTLYAQYSNPQLLVENPHKDGQYFLGWYDSLEVDDYGKPLGNKFNIAATNNDNATPITKNVTLYAFWSNSASRLFGDYDYNGLVSAVDALAAVKIGNGSIELPEEDMFFLDINADGFVDSVDAELIIKYVNSKITKEEYSRFNPQGIKIYTYPKTNYNYGEAFDIKGLSIKGFYPKTFYEADCSTPQNCPLPNAHCHELNKINGESLIVSGYDPYKIGYQQITINFYQYETSLEVYVNSPKYSIKYDPNGGTVSSNGKTVTYGSAIGTLSIPTRAGYTFLGWSYSQSGTTYVTSSTTYSYMSNKTLYAQWSQNKYTVTYSANGGSNAPISQTTTYGNTVTVPTNTLPQKTGYTFLGYSTVSNATTPAYVPGDMVEITGNTTLYAVWEEGKNLVLDTLVEGAISFNGQYNIFKFVPEVSGYYKAYIISDFDLTLDFADSGDLITGTEFSSEYVYLDAGKTYYAKTNATSLDQIGVYSIGVEKLLIEYVITLNNEFDYDVTEICVAEGENIELPILQQEGYKFCGWKNIATGENNITALINIQQDYELQAVWEELPTELNIDSSNSAVISTGGEIKYFTFTPTTTGKYVIYSTGTDDTKVYLYNASGTVLDSDDDDGDGNNFRLEYNLTAGAQYKYAIQYYNSSKTGTISFKFGNIYTISFNANGGTGAPSTQYKDYGTNITLSSTIPTRTGYTFKGWSTSSTATSATYQPGGTFITNEDTTLYAVWQANAYTISYNANGGTGAPADQTKTKDISLTLSSTTPKRTGYTFLGWATSSTVTSATYQPGGAFTANANTTLYAVWQANTTYTVSYNANGGSGAPNNQAKTHDVSLILCNTVPIRPGYTFLGWSTSSTATNATYQPGASFITNANTTLYAVWQANTYTIRYNSNGGNGTMSNSSHTYNVTKALTTNTFEKSGYIFLGWATSSTSTTVVYTNGQSVENLTSTDGAIINLYAVWQLDEPDVLLGDVNGDGEIDAGDAGLISRYDVGLITLTATQLEAGDVNGDGVVDAGDAGLISRYDAGLISSLG